MSENTKTAGDGISRRTVTKAMAWSVPAIAVAAPIPAFAASGKPPTVLPGKVFKWPGGSCAGVPSGLDNNKAYLFTFRVTNTSNKPIYIYSVNITTTSGITFNTVGMTPGLGTALAPNQSTDVSVWANSNSSGNLTFQATATISWGHNYPGPDPDNHAPIVKTWQVNGTPTTTSQGYSQCQNPGYVGL